MASELAAALVKVQAELKPIVRNAEGQVGNKKRKYADLAAVSAVVLPLLAKHGLAFTAWPTRDDGGQFILAYSLLHADGEERTGTYPLPASGNSQQIGGVITYARRYALCAVTGAAPEGEDDDAAGAQEITMDRPRTRTAWSDPEHQRLAQPTPDERVNGSGAQRFRGPARPDEWANPEDRPGSVTDAQMRKLQATLSGLFSKDERDQRLAAAEQIIGRQLTGPKDGRTSSNLSLTEASKLIDTLGGLTRDDLVARMAEAAP